MSLTDLEETLEEPSLSEAPKRRNAKRRRIRRRWVLLSLLLFGFAFLLFLNGPGFRLLAPLVAGKAARSQGLTGSLRVEGSLWSGFSLRDVEFSPLEPGGQTKEAKSPQLLSLKLGEATLSYRPWDLIRTPSELNWINRVRLDSLAVVLSLPSPEEGTPKEETKVPRETPDVRNDFHPIWNLLASDIEIANVSVAVTQGEQQYKLDGFRLESRAGIDGKLALGSVALPGQDPISNISVPLTKEEHGLQIGPIELGEVGSLHSLTVAEPSPTLFTVEAKARIAGGELSFSLDENRNLQASLLNGTSLDLENLFPDRRDEFPLEGTIETFSFRFSHPFDVPTQWDLEGNLVCRDLGWQGKTVDSAILSLQQGAFSLEARRPDGVIQAKASLPFSMASSTEELSGLPIDVNASAAIPDLQKLLSGIEVEIPLQGTLSLEAQNLQFDMKGNFNAGNLLLQTDDLAWDGLAIPSCQLAGIVEQPNQIKLAADLRLDAETGIRVTGTWDRENQNYMAEARGTLQAEGPLRDWLARNKGQTLTGDGDLRWNGTGNLKDSQHEGTANLQLNNLSIAKGAPLETSLSLSYENTSAQLREINIHAGDLSLSGTGEWDGKRISLPDWSLSDSTRQVMKLVATLPFDPESDDTFLEQAGDLHVQLDLDRLDLKSVLGMAVETSPVSGIASGNVQAQGSFRNLKAEGLFSFFPTLEQVENSQVLANFSFGGNVSVPRSWDANLDAEVTGLRWKDVELGTIDLSLESDRSGDGNLLAGDLHFAHAGTLLESKVQVDLSSAEKLDALSTLPLKAEALLEIESLGALLRDFAPPTLAGFPLDGSLQAELRDIQFRENSLLSGSASVLSTTLSVEEQTFDTIRIDGTVDRPDHITAQVVATLDSFSEAKGSMSYHLKEKSYRGSLASKLDLASEGKLRTLLSSRNIAQLLPASTVLDWEGGGNLNEAKHEGDLTLDAQDLALAKGSVPMDLSLSGSYSDESADFPDFKLQSDVLDLEGALNWDGKRLHLSEWSGTSSGKRILSLNASVPLSKESMGIQWFSQEEALELDLDLSSLSIESLSRLGVKESPIRGILDARLTAGGSPTSPILNGTFELANIRLPSDKDEIALGKMVLTLKAASDKASLSGNYQHPDLNPLSIAASLPFHPGGWSSGERSLFEEALTVSAKMEKSSLAFLAEQVPAIESVDGNIGINAELKGSISRPVISGDGILDITRLRFGDRNAPSLYDVDLSTRFAENKLTVDRLHAIVAGGEVSGKGSVLFAPESEPRFDFQVQGREVLLYRNPDVSLRTDADLTLSGPWSRARIAGEVGISNSRFFKNFDLLPRTLPTRNTSVLPTVEGGPSGGNVPETDLDLGVDVEPFRDWLADVRIYTKDPFLVRSNLVESDLSADIHIGKTLGAPVPRGYLAIAEGEMSLPFSSIDVETGRVEFDENTGFNGALEFKAKAKADKYRINVYLYNRVLDPKYVLTSVPPMPTEDLVSLLISGVPREDLVGEGVGTMAASKAALLLFKNMRKASAAADEEPNLLDDLQERTELEIGRINPETGEQTIGGKIRLWKQLFFVGDVDAQNDYRAVLKYVFRFR